jgi:DeoR/GlpR family transcriptional regulator of sugar metabolism
MVAAKRKMELYQLLQTNESVEVSDAANRFQVSTMTIRRDLAGFERQGLVTTTYGGAYLNKGVGIEPSFALKQGHMADAKQQIARAAAEIIHDGASIILDCGTSTMAILNYIQKKRITVITNSWSAIGYLHGNSRVKLILAPGEYDELSAGVVSSITGEFYHNYHADIVFVSTQGFDPKHGATVPAAIDADVKRALLQSGEKKVLLADSSKIGKKYLARHAKPEDFDIIITDSGTDPEQSESLKKCCKQLIIVK